MCGGVALDHQSDRVHVNDIAAAYEGTNYLLDLGHREILFLSDDEQKIGAGFQRITGSRKAMEERGLEFPESLVLPGRRHLRGRLPSHGHSPAGEKAIHRSIRLQR